MTISLTRPTQSPAALEITRNNDISPAPKVETSPTPITDAPVPQADLRNAAGGASRRGDVNLRTQQFQTLVAQKLDVPITSSGQNEVLSNPEAQSTARGHLQAVLGDTLGFDTSQPIQGRFEGGQSFATRGSPNAGQISLSELVNGQTDFVSSTVTEGTLNLTQGERQARLIVSTNDNWGTEQGHSHGDPQAVRIRAEVLDPGTGEWTPALQEGQPNVHSDMNGELFYGIGYDDSGTYDTSLAEGDEALSSSVFIDLLTGGQGEVGGHVPLMRNGTRFTLTP